MESPMEGPGQYVDVYVSPVAKSKSEAFKKFGADMSKLAVKHGALFYAHFIADDVKAGKQTSFPQAVMLKDGEFVGISWAVYKSREDRDRVNKAMMEDPTFHKSFKDAPFDMQRMFMGGFKAI